MNKITILKNENIIWLIYAFFVIFGIYANNLEIEDIKTNSKKNSKKYKTINIIMLILFVIIYFYFINITYNNYKKKQTRANTYLLIGSILVFIAGILYLLSELISNDAITPNEI